MLLSREKGKASTRIEVMLHVSLDNYDERRHEFTLSAESAMNEVKRMGVSVDSDVTACSSQEETNRYPRQIIFVLTKPFTLKAVPISSERASKYRGRLSQPSGVQDLVDRHRLPGAYVFMNFTVRQYVEAPKINGVQRPEFAVSLDAYQVFANPDKSGLMFASYGD